MPLAPARLVAPSRPRTTRAAALAGLVGLLVAGPAGCGPDPRDRHPDFVPPEITAAPVVDAPVGDGPDVFNRALSVPPQVVEAACGAEPEPLLGHNLGDDRYPCAPDKAAHDSCKYGSPPDGAVAIALGGMVTYDPNEANETEGVLVAEELFEGLLVRPPASGMDYQPGVATDWQLSDDGTVYTFTLRNNAKWSDGAPVTAHDFVYSWRRVVNPETGSKVAEILWFLKHGEAISGGKRPVEDLGVEAVDDHTLRVTLERPTAFWLHLVVTSAYAPSPKQAIEAHGKQWTRPENLVTNGPYVVTKYTPRGTLEMVQSETYWDKDNIRIPKILAYFSEGPEAAQNRYDLGQLHLQRSSLPTEEIQRFKSEARPDFFLDPYLCYYYFAFKLDRPPFDDVRVRRAINMALDKQRFVANITRGDQVTADSVMPPFYTDVMGYEKQDGDEYDPDRARELLVEAGYPKGVGLPPVDYIYNTSEGHRKIAEELQSQLKRELGMDIRLENMEWKSLLNRLRGGDFHMARSAWCTIPDPWDNFMILYGKSANNYGGYANAKFDEAFDQALAETDHGKRMALYAELEAMVIEDVPIAPLYHYTKSYLKTPVLGGVFPDLQNKHLIRYMYWRDRPQDGAPHPATRAAEARSAGFEDTKRAYDTCAGKARQDYLKRRTKPTAPQKPAPSPAAAKRAAIPPSCVPLELPAGAGAPDAMDLASAVRHLRGDPDRECVGHAVCAERKPEDGVLHVSETDPEFWDPSLAMDTASSFFIEELFEGLIVRGPTSGVLCQGVAESVTLSADGRTYTFKLRDDALWSDGTPVTAEDFRYAWARKLHPDTGARGADVLHHIKGAKAFNDGRVTDEATLGLRAPDPRTFVVELEGPRGFILDLIATSHYMPVPKHVVEAKGKAWSKPEELVTNGPYALDEYVQRTKALLSKDDHYWNAEHVAIDQIYVHIVEGQKEAQRLYDLGTVHWQRQSIAGEDLEQFIRDDRPDLYIDPMLCTYFYSMRVDQEPFDDPDVRRAVAMAIDRERIVKHVTKGGQQPATTLVPPVYRGLKGYPQLEGLEYDPDAARALLTKAGYPMGRGLPTITLVYNTLESHRRIAEEVQQQLKTELGIDIALENMEWKSLLKKVHAGDFQMSRMAWCAIPDPWGHLMLFDSESPSNSPGWKSEAFDAAFDAALATSDEAERMRLLGQAEAIVAREVPVAPLYFYTQAYLVKPYLEGIHPQLEDRHLLRYLRWKE